MLNALLVLAGSIGWSNMTTTGAEITCSSPRSGLILMTVGGSGARVGVGAGAVVGDAAVPWVVAGVLLAALAFAIVVTTPWEPLGDVGGVEADVGLTSRHQRRRPTITRAGSVRLPISASLSARRPSCWD
jgi:hypothetical protein